MSSHPLLGRPHLRSGLGQFRFQRPTGWKSEDMSFTTPESVPSGMALRVLEVQGHQPESLADFVGEDVGFVLDDEPHHLIRGSGRITEDVVRFHEKDMANNGKDIRVWQVSSDGSEFVAEQTPTF